MTTRRVLAFPRGISVGGNTRVSMPELRVALSAAGLRSPATVLNSGNIAVTTALPLAQVRATIERVLDETCTVVVPVLVFETAEVRAVIDGYPWDRADTGRQHYAVLMDDLDLAADLLAGTHPDPDVEELAPAPVGLYHRVLKGFTTTGAVAKRLGAARFKQHSSVRGIATLERLLAS